MSRGTHAVQHEAEHKIERDAQLNDGVSTLHKQVALLIAVLALFLAISEMLGKSAQTEALNQQILASNMWDLFQAKKDRGTQHQLAIDQARFTLATTTDPGQRAAIEGKIDEWEKTVARYQSEVNPATGLGEGTVQLQGRAIEHEKSSHEKLAEYHQFELASAAFQIGIVLASAMVLTGLARWSFPAGGLAITIGLGLMAFALFAPHVLPLH